MAGARWRDARGRSQKNARRGDERDNSRQMAIPFAATAAWMHIATAFERLAG
jgi:hypothetical protein